MSDRDPDNATDAVDGEPVLRRWSRLKTQARDAERAEAQARSTEQATAQVTTAGSASPESAPDEPAHYFRMMKELALLGYFTSAIGYTKAMRYRESPGRFDPCAPHAPGDKIWASHA